MTIESKVPRPENAMCISTPGVLLRASEVCKRSRHMKHLSYQLDLLNEHLGMLHQNPTEEMLVKFCAFGVQSDTVILGEVEMQAMVEP